MRKTKAAALMLAFVFILMCAEGVAAETYTGITENCTAKVVQVIDGDAIKVSLNDGKVALVRLVGVDAAGYDGALEYLTSQILGRTVQLNLDSYVSAQGRWNKMYVYLGSRLINSELLERGLAKTNTDDSNSVRFSQFTNDYSYGKVNELGQWAADPSSSRVSFIGNGLNINTATATQISQILKGVSYSVAGRVVSYRQKNPFNVMSEIKFVQGFTKEMYDDNRSYLAVSTNVATASRDELKTLDSITDTYVERIIDYRSAHNLNKISLLLDNSLVTSYIYNKNQPFISVNNRAVISYTVPEKSVNINRASKKQLTGVGISEKYAEAIINNRGKYSYKTLEELQYVSGISATRSYFDEWEDNLRVVTDINSAARGEIESLFGDSYSASEITKIISGRPYKSTVDLLSVMTSEKYEAIKPYIYVDNEPERKRINVNTCEYEELTGIGFTASQANSIINNREITHSSGLSAVSSLDDHVTLFTNINKAGRNELKSLGASMSDSLIAVIINYRNDQPFGSMDEVSQLFEKNAAYSLYNRIKKYIVLR